MCMICVEYYHQRMTREELKKALPEMVMYAKNEEERVHFKKLQQDQSDDELHSIVDEFMKTQSSNLKKTAR